MFRTRTLALALVILTASNSAWGAFVVDYWDLKTSVSERIADNTINDFESITAITNPLFETIQAQVNNNSYSRATFDYSWSPSLSIGDFNTTITHAIRAPESRAVSTGAIRFAPNEDVRVTISGTAIYSHTPGDLGGINFAALLSIVDTGEIQRLEFTRGGNLFFQPASGTLSYFAEVILPAGIDYKYEFSVDTWNTADLLPTGTMDVSATIAFTIEPVPEPDTALLMGFAAIVAIRRRRSNSALSTQDSHVRFD
ncbi:MAG: PEP-CTERM sorting domain-containing protein [Phycisphaerales bacterium]|nr:PEP-CTERM sorting domain-containing protein [Phycisphaerales bacterium]MCB9854067.1 PEP-CTERM sorting domain-containing protein [Phycisphaerales bacterium]MCB9864377.1 PEP-CTERM sorting domain-containing protein [Phycisphaerales bacterium]